MSDSSTPASADKNFEQASALLQSVKNEIKKVLIGQDDVIDFVLVTLVGEGHVLLEGVPGLGKTLLVRALATCFGGDFSRVQFTPDLMPSDVTGHAMFNMAEQKFEVRKGPVFTNLLLADEINRAPAKTQAALLEVMQEGQVTIEGEAYAIDKPFMVLATQNPVEQEGTYPLPEAELDRFMLKVEMHYPESDDELAMIKHFSDGDSASGFDLNALRAILKPAQVLTLRKIARKITVDDEVLAYIVNLVRATRDWHGIARGAGPRATIALLGAAKSLALLRGHSYVTPDDIKEIYLPALRHRILLSAELEIEGTSTDQVLTTVLQKVEAPRK